MNSLKSVTAKSLFPIIIIFILIISSVEGNTITSTKVSSSQSFENNVKIDDYVEYKITARQYQQLSSDNSLVGDVGIFKTPQTGLLRWTVTDINGTNTSLKIEVSIGDFFTDVKQIVISDMIAYTIDQKQLGYFPFWISLDLINSNSSQNRINLDGPVLNPLIGDVDNLTHNDFYLDGIRETISFSNHLNYPPIGAISYFTEGAWTWYYSKYNGILAKLGDYFPLFWSTLHFSYEFSGGFILTKSNIDFGPIDQFKTFLYQFGSFIDLLIMVVPIILFIGIIYLIRWFRKRYGK